MFIVPSPELNKIKGDPDKRFAFRSPFERTIPAQNLEIFWTGYSEISWGWDVLGYAIATETGGMWIAVGLVCDARSHYGFPIECFKGDEGGQTIGGW